ncbi:MAG: SIS domain-containing protein [Balneolaceae bacterium]|nr:SIS domain-containing protein [Balneolaceae bacterium]
MSHLLSIDMKSRKRGVKTSAEIFRQPETWEQSWEKIQNEEKELCNFLDSALSNDKLNIVLTGAGSSAFVGDVVASTWKQFTKKPIQAIPTTDLVTHFSDKIDTRLPLLLISFARSGNSPESTATIHQANELCDEVFHLIITCNPKGKLAQVGENPNSYVFSLPAGAEDQSLAMTNSFTSMTLSASIIPMLTSGVPRETIEKQVQLISDYGKSLLEEHLPEIEKAAASSFNRIVFLGSGPMWGIAKESHLKVQELTNGDVLGKFDSFLGFRHGPKAIINKDTLIVYLLSNQQHPVNYEKDLIEQIAQHNIDLHTLLISESPATNLDTDFAVQLNTSEKLNEVFWCVLCTLPAQVIGFNKSVILGYDPDSPSPGGTISRVVKGVKIYNDVHHKNKG